MSHGSSRRFRFGRLVVAPLALGLLAVLGYASTFAFQYDKLFRHDDPLDRMDVARLAPARVLRIDAARDVEQLQAIVRDANARGLKVSISGSRHSQGGDRKST